MYYPRDQIRQQIICYYLRQLYPVCYPEEQLQRVLTCMDQCTTMVQLNRVLLSPDFVREERLWQAYYHKRNQLVPPDQRRWPVVEKRLWPLPAWIRELFISCIKSLMPYKVKRQPISQELYEAIQACTTLQELSGLVHSQMLTRVREIDAFEKRFQELP